MPFELDDDLGFDPDNHDLDLPVELAGEDEANRMLRRRRAAEAEVARVTRVAADDIAQTSLWRDRRIEGARATIAWAERSLEGWLRALQAQGGQKTVTLPAGTVRLRKAQRRIDIAAEAEPTDSDSASAWAVLAQSAGVDNPISVVYKLAKRSVREIVSPGPVLGPAVDGMVPHAAVGQQGEVVPGVIVHEPTDAAQTFSATSAKPVEEDLDAELHEAG